jgi:hypothetical protein
MIMVIGPHKKKAEAKAELAEAKAAARAAGLPEPVEEPAVDEGFEADEAIETKAPEGVEVQAEEAKASESTDS